MFQIVLNDGQRRKSQQWGCREYVVVGLGIMLFWIVLFLGPCSRCEGDKMPAFKGGDHVQDDENRTGIVVGMDDSCHGYFVKLADGMQVLFQEKQLKLATHPKL